MNIENIVPDNRISIFLSFTYTLGLTFFGEALNLFKTNSDIISMCSILFQWFAWGGAGIIGFISVIKFLQDNGFIKKGKAKK